MSDRVSRITAEIAAVVEKNLRLELLREREAMLGKELESVRAELDRLGGKRPASRPGGKPASGKRPVPKPMAKKRPAPAGSARALMLDILKRSRRPMTTTELTRVLLRRGWKSKRANPADSVDAALRNNPQDFQRTAPNTFELKK